MKLELIYKFETGKQKSVVIPVNLMALSNKKSLVELLLKVLTNREANSLEKVSFRIIQEVRSVRLPKWLKSHSGKFCF